MGVSLVYQPTGPEFEYCKDFYFHEQRKSFKSSFIPQDWNKKSGNFQVKLMTKIDIVSNLEEWACMRDFSQLCGGPLENILLYYWASRKQTNCLVMMYKEGSVRFVKFITPLAGAVVLGNINLFFFKQCGGLNCPWIVVNVKNVSLNLWHLTCNLNTWPVWAQRLVAKIWNSVGHDIPSSRHWIE